MYFGTVLDSGVLKSTKRHLLLKQISAFFLLLPQVTEELEKMMRIVMMMGQMKK